MAERSRARLDALIRRVEADSGFLAAALRDYTASEGLTDQDLAERLGCPVDALDAIRLCRRPRPEAADFRQDVARIAERFGIRAAELARIVRQVDALAALRRDAPSDAGELRAARDRESDPDGESGGR